jgi:hypothetical protein
LKETSSGKSVEKKLSREDMANVVARARKAQEESLKGYREQSLRLHPWICTRCGREFTNKNLHMLTVHHIDHDHENNPVTVATGRIFAYIVMTMNTGDSWIILKVMESYHLIDLAIKSPINHLPPLQIY